MPEEVIAVDEETVTVRHTIDQVVPRCPAALALEDGGQLRCDLPASHDEKEPHGGIPIEHHALVHTEDVRW